MVCMQTMSLDSLLWSTHYSHTIQGLQNVMLHFITITVQTPTILPSPLNYSQFLHGYGSHGNPLASGLVLFLSCTGVNIHLTSVTLCGNHAQNNGTGGNLTVIYRNRMSIITNAVVTYFSYICSGIAQLLCQSLKSTATIRQV